MALVGKVNGVKAFRPNIALANTTGGAGDPFDVVVINGFSCEEEAREFAEKLVKMRLVEPPVPFLREARV